MTYTLTPQHAAGLDAMVRAAPDAIAKVFGFPMPPPRPQQRATVAPRPPRSTRNVPT